MAGPLADALSLSRAKFRAASGTKHVPKTTQTIASMGIAVAEALVQPCKVKSMAEYIVPRERSEPTERSIPPVRITRVIPTATIPMMETWRSTSD